MVQTAQCPSCGASVAFQSNVSVLAVCAYCRTTLLDVDGRIENLGRMAELAQDRSRLQIGAQGVYRQKPFTVVGRIQLQFEQGLWSEWFLLFSDQSTGWFSEAAGAYSVSFQRSLTVAVPTYSELHPGSALRLNNTEWTVTNVERATCVTGEGELPFKVGSGYPAPVVDLRSSASNAFITLDYSEDENKPLLFVGEAVDFSSLKWRNLREDDSIHSESTLQAKALLCRKCGAQLELKHEGILSIACAHCGSVTDPETGELISIINEKQKVIPLISIGYTGIFRGEKLEVIGFMQRYMVSEGMRYYWREYLLARVGSPGYRWLIESDGHWNVVDVLEDILETQWDSGCHYREQFFKHFQSYKGVVDYVIGEFTWRVVIGETVDIDDYVAPPFSLSREITPNEMSWSHAEYVPSQEIATAFNIKNLPKPDGIYLNQPNPTKSKIRPVWVLFFLLTALAILMQIIFSMSSNSLDNIEHNITILKTGDQSLSPPIVLSKNSSLEVKSRATGLKNEWLELGLALVREADGEARYGSVELSYYSGWDAEDGTWSENDTERTLVFPDVPPGTWRLLAEEIDSNRFELRASPVMVNAESGSAGTVKNFGGMEHENENVHVFLTIGAYPPSFGNFLLLLFALLTWPVALSFKYYAFETTRWKESDHPKISTEQE